MTRKERRRQDKRGQPAAGTKPSASWRPPEGDGVAGPLMGYATTGTAAAGKTADDPAALLRIAIGHFRSGRQDDAARNLDRVLQLRPDDPTALQLSGVIAQQRGDGARALALLQRAVELAPDYGDARHNLGLVLLNRGDVEAAETHLRRAVALQPDFAAAAMNLGNVLRLRGLLAEAESRYRTVLALEPDLVEAQLNLANVLKETGRHDEALADYDRIVADRPAYALAHSNRGECLAAMGRLREARDAFARAHELAPDDDEFAGNLRDTQSRLIPNWHLPMLADAARNHAYAEAIARQVGPGDTVLDIGTGSGLLAMMAARAGAGHVWAAELNPDLADVAGEIVAANGFADTISIVNKASTDMRIGDDLPAPVQVIVAEIFDAGLLGEGAIPSLRHAVHELLADGGRLIPRAAAVRAKLVELPRWRAVNPVGSIAGFDLSAFDRFRNPASHRALDLKREHHVALSAPFDVVRFDFADLPTTERWRRVQVPVTASGYMHAVACWFDLELDDEVTVSGAPGGPLEHWQQAVQFFDDGHPVAAGETVALTVGHTDARIYFKR